MEITSYKVNPQAFFNDLDKVDLNQLAGSQSSALAPLLQFLKDKEIIISELGSGVAAVDHEALLTKMLAYFMPADATLQGGHYDSQIKGGIVHLKAMLTSAVAGNPAAKPACAGQNNLVAARVYGHGPLLIDWRSGR